MHLVSWENAVNRDRAELIFSNRNQAYGGYVIRRDYEKLLVYALLLTLVGIALIVAIPVVIGMMSKPVPVTTKEQHGDPIKFIDPPSLVNPVIIPPTVVPQTHIIPKTLIFVPSRVVPDVLIKDPAPTNTQQGNSQNGSTDAGAKINPDGPSSDPIIEVESPPVISAEEMPIFPGGESGLLQYLGNHIKYPELARENRIEGTVYISFVVDKKGKIKDAKLLNRIGGGCDEEALRVVNSLPQWKPGKQNGKLVSVVFNVPVHFKLN